MSHYFLASFHGISVVRIMRNTHVTYLAAVFKLVSASGKLSLAGELRREFQNILSKCGNEAEHSSDRVRISGGVTKES